MKAAKIVFLVLGGVFFALGVALLIVGIISSVPHRVVRNLQYGFHTLRQEAVVRSSVVSLPLLISGGASLLLGLFFGLYSLVIWCSSALRKKETETLDQIEALLSNSDDSSEKEATDEAEKAEEKRDDET